MRTLLFPTDFSQASENAEKFAIEVAKRKNAKLYLLHVNDEYEEGMYNNVQDDDTQVLIKETPHTKLKKIVKKYELDDENSACLVKYGESTDVILTMIEDLDADIVILGTNGNKDYERSNTHATEIVRSAECSVFTIPVNFKYKPITHIVYATDLIHKDDQAFDHLVKFAKAFAADITLLHVNIDGEDEPAKGRLKSIPEIKDAIDYPILDTKVVIAASLIEGIDRYLDDNDVDVLAMTSHSNAFLDRFFRDSKIEKMVLSSQIPILTFVD